MTARTTYAASIASATATNVASNLAANVAYQETINAGGNAVAALCSGSGNASYVSKVAAAQKAAVATLNANAAVAIAAADAAKNTLRATGDVDIF